MLPTLIARYRAWMFCSALMALPALAQTAPSGAERPAADLSSNLGSIALSPSPSARELFANTRDAIVQVRVLLASANEQATLGSGFVARDLGVAGALVVTNFHVIADLAVDPDKYRIELRGTNQRLVSARLVAVDVIHDLAVLRTEPAPGVTPTPWQVLPLNADTMSQGAPVYALGNPLELGFLISEGLYNGSVEKRLYEQMLFSGSLNSGMSGGPAINQAGEVIGVNVATRRDGEQLSFLVPARYAKLLLEGTGNSPSPTDWRPEIGRQLLAHQAHIFSKFQTGTQTGQSGPAVAGMSTQRLGDRTVPTLDGSLTRCWAQGRTGEKLLYRSDALNCSLSEDVFAGSGVYAGSLRINHRLVRNDQLATPQFIALGAEIQGAKGGMGGRNRAKGQCHDDYVQARDHVYRVAVCVQAYRKFNGLFDYTLTATQVDSTSERLSSSLSMKGLSFENAQALSRLFLERMQ
ncbi:serine protease [Hydrogenophaga sp. PAMC20947]|uniref:S1C family serine protease n=1 Tax=Hydrogenophaga sp. PAMC20947 TaxID=2565558 RepID=UPI00109DC525|nr:serine protease [Hydrogenophaga sp. PAMC20947]QCB45612.1 serine protease [Hydrogenophaga sp. PAMC20947]